MNIHADGVLPWGIGRMAPFRTADTLPYTRVELDPVSQLGLRFSPDGRVIEMSPKHGTSRASRQPTQTSGPDGGDPRRPPSPDRDEAVSYERD